MSDTPLDIAPRMRLRADSDPNAITALILSQGAEEIERLRSYADNAFKLLRTVEREWPVVQGVNSGLMFQIRVALGMDPDPVTDEPRKPAQCVTETGRHSDKVGRLVMSLAPEEPPCEKWCKRVVEATGTKPECLYPETCELRLQSGTKSVEHQLSKARGLLKSVQAEWAEVSGENSGLLWQIRHFLGMNPDPVTGECVHQVGTASPHHGLDTDDRVCFYERDFYPLSNFSAFRLSWCSRDFDTSEHAYHWARFEGNPGPGFFHQRAILRLRSAHEAFRYAQDHKADQRPGWDAMKVDVMRDILRAKASQHEYVRRKLLATGERELVEDSWRDDFWGWGPNRDGQNMLGRLWMEVRAELRTVAGTKS